MEIRVADHAGFCAGVKRAIRLALEAACRGEEVYTLGPLVHNRQVVEYLKDKGVKYVEGLGEINHGTVVFRSHGAGPGVYDQAKEKGLAIVDATCPFVKKVQEKVCSLAESGYKIIIAGDLTHPEVQGLVDWSRGHAVVIEDEGQLEDLKWDNKMAIIAQTTVREEFLNRLVERAKANDPEVAVYRTICQATRLRQKAAVELAGQVDLMLVIGGYNSSNTRKLAAACNETGTPTYHIEEAAELKKDWLDNIKITGVTAGASTPVWSIKEVIRIMSEFNNEEFKEENVEEEENEEKKEEEEEVGSGKIPEEPLEGEETEEPEEAVEEAAEEEAAEEEGEEVTAEVEEEEEVTEETYDREITPIEKGEIVKGKVVQVADDELLVDVGYKMDGIVPRSEVDVKSGESLKDTFQVDDEMDLYVLKVPVSDDDKLLLSKKRYDREKYWQDLEQAFNNQEVLTCQVSEVVKGGLIVDLGVRGFLPASLVDLRYVPDLQEFVGEDIQVKIIELNRAKNKVVVSRKAVLEEEMEQKKKETMETIEEGMVIKGIVRRLTDFGAFVDIGGIDGLVHISEISWQRIDHPSDVLNVGEEIEVKVLSINPEEDRISLSIKHAKPDPWTLVTSKFTPGEIVEGNVKCIVDFGVFVEIMPGVEGLVHISQLAEEHVTHPSEIVSEGEDIQVKILDINAEDKRISLSLKEARREEEGEKEVKEEKKKEETSKKVEEDESKGSGVTLGDVFGDLFDREEEEDKEEEE